MVWKKERLLPPSHYPTISSINAVRHPHTRSSTRLPSLSNAFCSFTRRGRVFLWVPAPSSKREAVILIEYSIGEPFSKRGNGIRRRINVLYWGKRSHHHFSAQAVFKKAFSLPSLRAMSAKWHGFLPPFYFVWTFPCLIFFMAGLLIFPPIPRHLPAV